MSRRTRRERRILADRRLRAVDAPVEVEEVRPSGPWESRPASTEADGSWIDLLHAVPRIPLETELLQRALRFAFESGDAGGLLGVALDRAPLSPSTWELDTFDVGLFLGELVDECFTITIAGRRHVPSRAFLLRVLGAPPSDLEDVRTRGAVLEELASSVTMRAALEGVYEHLKRLRALLDETSNFREETIRRKVDVLEAIRGFVESAEGLAEARSPLRRVHVAAKRLAESPAYRRLLEVLDFERNLATVDLRITLGSDGRIRDLALIRLEENRSNPLVRPTWRRALERFASWVRGHRYHENEVLLRVLDDVFDELEPFVIPLFGAVGHVEVHLAALGFRDRAAREGLSVSLAEIEPTPALGQGAGATKLEGLFNPLLFLQGARPVPCDFSPGGHDALVLVTGPNSGGKTRLLQAVGIAQVLGQSGLFVPARTARLTQAPGMFVSLIESGRADESEGRLGTELRRVRRLFEALRPGAIAILDELCSGTNPSEGIAIFELVVSLLPRLRPQVLLTTHFLDAARRLQAEGSIERLELLQVELDARSEPTYQFVPGVAPTSLAHQVAGRLGVTHEELEALVERQLARATRG
ncbi:MAG: DNA mismatch repair protein [Sandaracinus sp.]|nr:DNA mismatch repair protein [Sandaracinus sp.]MCB9632840.1 DNA mismatch repair protein [Sandaracinus sp.]